MSSHNETAQISSNMFENVDKPFNQAHVEKSRQSKVTTTSFETHKNFAYRTIQYLLGNVSSKLNQSKRQTMIENEPRNPSADAQDVLFQTLKSKEYQNLADTLSATSDQAAPQKKQRKMTEQYDKRVSVEQSMFNQKDNIVNEYEIKSTLSSENEQSQIVLPEKREQEAQYQILEDLLSSEVIGDNHHGSQRIFIESMFSGLFGDQTSLFQIPCFLSADKKTFMVFVNKLNTNQFSKNTLFNLVDSAQKVSEECSSIILIMDRQVTHYSEMKRLFSIIDAKRMTSSQLTGLLSQVQCAQTLQQYGFFELSF